MLAHRKPHCGFCLKEFSKSKDVQLHIANTPKCRASRAAQNWEINHQSTSPVMDRYNNPNPLDPDLMMVEHDEADFIPRERLWANDNMA